MQVNAIEKEGETVDEALQYALDELEADMETVEYEVLDEGGPGDEDQDGKPVLVRVWRKNPEEVNLAKTSLQQILRSLDMDAEIELSFEWSDNTLSINIVSDDAGILIGRQGQTLDALQYLLQLVVNSKDVNIVLDVANYRERHKEHLIEVAEGIAERVLRRRRRITLKPMDARDRKIIHEAIKPFPELSSSSVGVEPNRRVVVSLKRADYTSERSERSDRGGERGDRGGERGGRSRYRHSRHRYQHR
ncbi:MAG: RNA-binding cell elongation regulator Jag/EloR [Candidatus Sericytochromatia bacterium]